MTAETPPKGRSRRTAVVSATEQVVGVIGIVVSVLLIVGVLFARGWATDSVDKVAGSVDGGLAKGASVVDRASSVVSDVSGRASTVANAADHAAATNAATSGSLPAVLAGEINAVSDRYVALRSAYADFREAVLGALNRINAIDAALPGISIPQGPTDALQALDAKIRALDAQITAIINASPIDVLSASAASAIASAAHNIVTALQGVTASLDQVDARLAGLRSDVAAKADSTRLIINVFTIVMILLLLYLAVLHWVLLRAGRASARRTAASGASGDVSGPSDVAGPTPDEEEDATAGGAVAGT